MSCATGLETANPLANLVSCVAPCSKPASRNTQLEIYGTAQIPFPPYTLSLIECHKSVRARGHRVPIAESVTIYGQLEVAVQTCCDATIRSRSHSRAMRHMRHSLWITCALARVLSGSSVREQSENA
jgi:hypothetical protein